MLELLENVLDLFILCWFRFYDLLWVVACWVFGCLGGFLLYLTGI